MLNKPLNRILIFFTALSFAAWIGIVCVRVSAQNSTTIIAVKSTTQGEVPTFQVDPAWPKPFPHNWQIGDVSGVMVDLRDHIWIANRYRMLDDQEKAASLNPPAGDCCIPAPPVIEFDPDGNVIQGWGGPNPAYEWPEVEHGVFVDYKDHVWVTAADTASAAQILKFTRDGKFLLQIGHQGQNKGSKDTANMSQPQSTVVDSQTNEVFVADGNNRRVVVWDADTGAFKRYWGAYGEQPEDGPQIKYDPSKPPSRQFSIGGGLHCIHETKHGEIYVCDRNNDRFQVFKKDGTFVKEVIVSPKTLEVGSVADVNFSPDERFIYVADPVDGKVLILRMDNDQIIGSFGRQGRYAGQFHFLHNVVTDSKGNIYAGEASGSRRIQKFRFTGIAKYNPSAE